MAKKAPPVVLPPIVLKPSGKWTNDLLAALTYEPGYNDMMITLGDLMVRRVDRMLMDYTQQQVALRYEIDGIWHQLPARDRMSGDAILVLLKKLAALNPADRRSRQEGKFKAELNKIKHTVKLTSQGVPTGERVLVEVINESIKLDTLDLLGMRDTQIKTLKEWLGQPKGLVVFSAPPGQGLRTTWRVGLGAADKFIRDFVLLHDETYAEDEIINVDPRPFSREKGQTLASVLGEVMLKEPDVLVVPEIREAETLDALLTQVHDNDKLVITRVRAKNAAEALIELCKIGGDRAKLADALVGVTNQRLLRKLCPDCKEVDPRTPQILQRFQVPPGRVEAVYRERQPLTPQQVEQLKQQNQQPPPPCPTCAGIGYQGRSGVFELLTVTDPIRQVLKTQPRPDVIAKQAQATGHRLIPQEAILTICLGTTSYDEVQRILQQTPA